MSRTMALDDDAADVVVADTSRTTLWSYVAFTLANLGLCVVYGGVLQVLLATQVDEMVGSAARVGQLAIVTSVGALSSMVAQPVAGWIADRTHLRVGRRNIWILLGGVLSLVLLLPVATSSSVWMLTAAWAVAMWPLNMVQVNLSAFIPERTPDNRRGLMSGVMGVARYGGMTVGVWLVSLTSSTMAAYVVIGIACAVATVMYALTTKDIPPLPRRPRRERGAATEPNVLFTARAHDFWLAFASRFCVIGSYFLVTGYMLYLLQDYIGYGDGTLATATTGVAVVSLVITIGNLVCSVIGGMVSDRIGRLKVFVVAAAALFVVPAVLMFAFPSWRMLLVSAAIIGIGFGTYNAVDQALVARVLPSRKTAARDLGIINFADAGPQTVAPTIAAVIVTATGDYGYIFVAMGAFCALGAVIATRIRAVR
ncbi:MAG TPA: MFS transporter [Cellulomonas sp.]